jgi:hypothetical protein
MFPLNIILVVLKTNKVFEHIDLDEILKKTNELDLSMNALI